jgi:gliding motility-associated-like protein
MKPIFNKRLFAAIIAFVFASVVHAQLLVTTGQTPTWYVENVLLGGGVTVSNVTYVGPASSIGHFQTGGTSTNLGLSEGLIMSTGVVNGTPAIGSAVTNFASTDNLSAGDALLNSLIPGYATQDAAILEFDFFPLSDTIRFRYVFGSEEYPEWVGSNYNDVFGFFVTGPNPLGGNYTNKNIALIPGTATPVAINNIHSGSYAQYYVDNQALNGQTIVFDGFTTALEAWLVVTPCVNYHIKIAIADAGDGVYDSAVFLEANSFGTNAFTVDVEYTVPGGQNFAVEGCADALVHFQIPQALSSDFILNYTIAGTAINGVDYDAIPTSITIPAGQTITTLPISPIFDGITEGTETVYLVFTNTCGVSDSVEIFIWDYQVPSAVATGEISFCESAASQVQLGVTTQEGFDPFSYTWDNGAGTGQNPIVSPSVTTTYTVTATDLCGYNAEASVTVTVFPDPDVTIIADPPGVCEGYSTTLTASGANTYMWTNLSSTTNPITVYPATTTTYYVVGTDGNGCFGQDSIVIPVNPSPDVQFEATPLEGCAPMNVQFNETSPDDNISQWSWHFGNGSTSSQENPSYTYSVEGTYDIILTLTNIYGCVSSDTLFDYINVWPQAVADFYTIPEIGKTYDPTITFYSDYSSQYWRWIFGDSEESSSPPPVVHTYPSAEAHYDATLIVYNDFGCNDTISKVIFIIDDILFFPNIITPNGDNVNDVLEITNADKYPSNLLQVFNRWGKLVFEMKDYDNSWDGDELADGTYYYIFHYIDKTHHSSLTILRE